MSVLRCMPLIVCALLMGLIIPFSALAKGEVVRGQQKQETAPAIPEPGPDAMGLQVWTNKDPGESFQDNDPLIIQYQAENDGYLAVLAVSSGSRVKILFPNQHMQDNRVEKGRFYTLFGDDSSVRLRVGKTADPGKLVIMLSSRQFKLDPFTAKDSAGIAEIVWDDEETMRVLGEALELIAGDPKFNRIIMPLSGSAGESLGVVVAEYPAGTTESGPSPKRLPSGIVSEKPASVTGTQGAKVEPLR